MENWDDTLPPSPWSLTLQLTLLHPHDHSHSSWHSSIPMTTHTEADTPPSPWSLTLQLTLLHPMIDHTPADTPPSHDHPHSSWHSSIPWSLTFQLVLRAACLQQGHVADEVLQVDVARFDLHAHGAIPHGLQLHTCLQQRRVGLSDPRVCALQ